MYFCRILLYVDFFILNIKLLALTNINIVDDTHICKYLFGYFYLQNLLAPPVPNVYLEKDVALPEFVVRIFIHYVLEMLYKNQRYYIKILNRIFLYLQTLVAQQVLSVFLEKDVFLTPFVVRSFTY